MRPLVWFRSDLRIESNPALHQACKLADKGVIGAFAVCPQQWNAHDWGPAKVDFVLRHVEALSQSLARLNVPLLILKAKTFKRLPKKLLDLARNHQCDHLFFNREHEINEIRRDEAVTRAFEKSGLQVRPSLDQLVFDPTRIVTQNETPYTIFTPFKKKWRQTFGGGEAFDPPGRPKRQPKMVCASDPVPASPASDCIARPDLWPAGEKKAAARLKRFIENRVRHYDRDRDHPAVNGTSTLSPYLSAGVISIHQCIEAGLAANAGKIDSGKKAVVTWIDELIWREFYRYLISWFPRLCMHQPMKGDTDRVRWRRDESQFQAWCEGRTGVPIVDAGMRQLNQTAWMHNRLRMITAMFLTKNLLIDWRWGERYFMQHLVDGDLANNNGGWQWSASTGADAAPYFRIFNPYTQSKKIDPAGRYIRKFVPELADLDDRCIHEPHRSPSTKTLDYPGPIVDVTETRRRAIQAFQRIRTSAKS